MPARAAVVAFAPATVVMMGTLYASASLLRFFPSMTSTSFPAADQATLVSGKITSRNITPP